MFVCNKQGSTLRAFKNTYKIMGNTCAKNDQNMCFVLSLKTQYMGNYNTNNLIL